MRCPKCSKHATKKERVGGLCPHCKWAYRIDPPDPLSDYELEHAIQTVSSDGAFRYTRAELIAEVERVLIKRAARIYGAEADTVLASDASYTVWWFVLGLVVVGGTILFVFREMCGTPLLVMAVGVAVSRLMRRNAGEVAAELRAKVETHDARAPSLVDRYLLGQKLALLIEPPAPAVPAVSLAVQRREFDLEAYGFDRVIVVQGDEMVEMLVKNQFHFQHNAAIVSFGGYPHHVAELVDRELSKRGAQAAVFLLHDASAEGRALVRAWRERYPLVKKLYDVGLSAAHTQKLLPRRASPLIGEPVEPDYAGPAVVVRLSALRPKQAMTLLFNAMAAADQEGDAPAAVAGVGAALGAAAVVGAADEANASFDDVVETSFDFG